MSKLIFGKELVMNEEAHAYTWGGAFVPGVTTILQCIAKPTLIQWSAGMASDHWLKEIKCGRTDFSLIHKEAKVAHRKKMEASGSSGSNVHEYVEAHIKGLPLPELKTDEAKTGAEAFHKWLDAHKVKFLASERLVFSQSYYYAGTCDFVAEIDGVLAVGDFKTGSGIYPEMRLQTAAYQHAMQEEKGIKFPVRWIVRLDKKTGEFEAKSFYNFDLDFAGFLAALNLHKSLKSISEEAKEEKSFWPHVPFEKTKEKN